MTPTGDIEILCFATQGNEHLDGERIRTLLAPLEPRQFAFARGAKAGSALALLREVRARRPDLIVMEGTGIGGGLALLAANSLLGVPYVVSSGDAVGPFLHLHSRAAGVVGSLYERALCERCAGFIGWTPYLAGRALTLGAPRAMTAPGWSAVTPAPDARSRVRAELGVAEDTLLLGLVGSLQWSERAGYVYGAELVQALRRVSRRDVAVCVLGDGDGRGRLEQLAGEDLGSRVLLPGRVPADRVGEYLAAFDLGSLSQSVDGVGSFRYTIKLSEYLACELPVVTGETPLAYDLDEGFTWRLPGDAPWSETYIEALAQLLEGLTHEEVARRREAIATRRGEPFDLLAQQRRVTAFVTDIVAAARSR